ncbi:MAG: response regulator [Planctomycetota bacterium]|jgi:excisionase family DNA binding protein|nr:response regulator [Planctomycetota bacterium]
MTTPADHLSLGRIAKLCHVSRTTVYRWIINGHLKAYTLPSGHFRVKPDDLSSFCQSFGIPDPKLAAAEEAPPPAPSPAKLRVLIADDHPDMVLVLRKVVERYLPDAEIHEAVNGVDTCIAVGTIEPQLVLLDIMMPGMDGFAVLQELLRRPELNDSRVLVVSAYEPFDRVLELERQYEQVVACLRKPISVEGLGSQLRAIAGSFHSRSN